LRAQTSNCAEQNRPAYAKSYGAACQSPRDPHIYFNPRPTEKFWGAHAPRVQMPVRLGPMAPSPSRAFGTQDRHLHGEIAAMAPQSAREGACAPQTRCSR
jgi:hypothetical protein